MIDPRIALRPAPATDVPGPVYAITHAQRQEILAILSFFRSAGMTAAGGIRIADVFEMLAKLPVATMGSAGGEEA